MSDNLGDVSFTLTIDDVERVIAETKAEVKKAKIQGTLTLNVREAIAEFETAKSAMERDKVKLGFDTSLLGRSLRSNLAEQLASNLKLLDAKRKGELAAYSERDARDRKAARDRLKAARDEAKELSRVLGSGQRPTRGALGRSAAAFADRSPDVVAKYSLDLHPAEIQAQKFREQILAQRLTFKPGMDNSKIYPELEALDLRLAEFQDQKDIPVHLVGETRVARDMIKETLAQVRADALRGVSVRLVSEGNLTKIRGEVDKLRIILKQPLEARVLVRDNVDKVQRKLRDLQAQTALSNVGLGRMQKLFLGLLLAAGPLAISLGGVATAIGAIGSAAVRAVGAVGVLPGLLGTAAGAFATLKVGFGGVGDALKAYGTNQKAAAKETIKTLSQLNAVRNATEQLADANYALGQTKTQGTDAINQLLDQRLSLTQQLKAGELSIRRAEADRAKTLVDLNRQLRDLKLNQDDAAQSVRDAQIGLNNANILGDPEEIKRASIALQKAKNAASDQKQDDGTLLGGGADLLRDEANAQAQAVKDAQSDLAKQLGGIDDQLTKQRIENARALELANRSVRDAGEGLADAQAEAAAGTKAQTTATNDLATALAKLSPNARDFVNTVNQLRGAWQGVRTAVQEALFDGAAAGFRNLTSNYVPILTTGLGGIAAALNGISGQANQFFNSTDGMTVMKSILDNIKVTLEALQPAIKPFLDALTTIIDVSTGEMPGLVGQFTDLLNKFNAFIQGAANDGSLATWITDGVTALGDLIELVAQLGIAFSNITSAMDQGGGLQGMIDSLKSFNDAIAVGGPARDGLVGFFKNLATATETVFTPQLASTIGDFFSAFGENLVTIAPGLRDFLQSFTGFVAKVTESGALTSILNGLMTGLTAVFDALSRPEVISAIQSIAIAFGDLLAAVGPALGAALAAILPVVTPLITAFSDLVVKGLQMVTDFIAAHPDFIGGVAVAIGAVMGAIQLLLPVIVPLVGAFAGLVVPLLTLLTGGASLSAIAAAISAVAAVVLPVIGTIAAVAAGIALLVVGLVDAYNNSDTFRGVIEDLWNALKVIGSFIKDQFLAALDQIRQAWDDNKESIQPVLDVLRTIGQFLAVTLLSAVVGAAGVIGGVLVVAFRLVGAVISTVIDYIGDVIKYFKGLYDFFAGIFTGDMGRAVDGLKEMFSGFFGLILDGPKNILNIFGGLGDKIAGYLSLLPGQLATAGAQLFAWVATKATDAYNGAKAIFDKVVQFFTDLPGVLLQAGASAFLWLIDKGTDLQTAISEKVVAIVEFFQGLPGRLASAGATAFLWLIDKGKALQDDIALKVVAIVGFFQGLPGRLATAGSSAFAWLVQKGLDLKQSISDRVGDIVGFFVGLPGRIESSAKSVFQPLVSGFATAINKLLDLWNNFSLGLKFPDSILGIPLPGGIAGKEFKVETPNLPHISVPALARGGTTTGPTLAYIGDNKSGRERVKPEDADGFSTDTRILDKKLDFLRDRLIENMAHRGNNVNLNVGGGVREILMMIEEMHQRQSLESGGISGILDRITARGAAAPGDAATLRGIEFMREKTGNFTHH